jgi:hypothetical protein
VKATRNAVFEDPYVLDQGAKARPVPVHMEGTHGLDDKQRTRPLAMSDVVEIGSLAHV